MWYVVQTTSGKEENIKIQGETYLPAGLVEKYVIPLYEERRRFHGEWHTLQKKLFPGYVFFISDQAEELFLQLKKVPAMTKMLGIGDEIVALTPQEIEFILRFCGEDDIAEISEGVIENDQVHILSGPLMGWKEPFGRLTGISGRHGWRWRCLAGDSRLKLGWKLLRR